VREGLQSELLRNEPPPLLFIGLGTGVRALQTTLEWTQGPTKKHHVEGQDGPPQGLFSQPVGSADPLWGHLDLCFLVVAVRWVLKAAPGVHALWVPVGHSIHVRSTRRPLIRRGVSPLN
jgi:hypothetical protein